MVVVGAGPAGSSAALALARKGIKVLLVDRTVLPRWKVCGGCLGPATMTLLESLELAGDVRRAGAVELASMELRVGGRRARLDLPGTVSLSRHAFDALLADAVPAAGGDVRFGVRVERVSVVGDGAVELRVRVDGEEQRLRPRLVVDATGLGGLHFGGRVPEEVAPASRLGLGAVFSPASHHGCPPGELRMTVGAEGYVGMVRTEDGSLDVAAAADRALVSRVGPARAVATILHSSGGSLPEDDPVFGWRGTPALTRRSVRAAEGPVFRVGDAAGYVEPFTGEGMGWAIAAGVSVAPYLEQALDGDVDRASRGWIAAHRRVVGRRQRLCRLLAVGLRRPGLTRAVVGLVGRLPVLARPFVAATGRVATEARVASRRATRAEVWPSAGVPSTSGQSTLAGTGQ